MKNLKSRLKLYQQLSLLLNAGLQLDLALTVLLKTETNHQLQDALKKIKNSLFLGKTLHQALTQFPTLFPNTHLAFIQAGEQTGKLPTALDKLVDLLEQQQRTKQQIKEAVRYPLCMLIGVAFITLGIFYFIIPQYHTFFNEFGGRLPALTQSILVFSSYTQQHAVLLIDYLALFSLALYFAYQFKTVQLYSDSFVLFLPFFGALLIQKNFSRWFNLVTLACQTHLPLIDGITLAKQSISNKALLIQIEKFETHLTQGKNLHDILSETQLFYPEILQLIQIGENTGNLTACLLKITRYYQSLFTQNLEKLIHALEPITMLLLAAITGTVVTALYLPMVNFGLHLQ